jgi:hypothetical protein
MRFPVTALLILACSGAAFAIGQAHYVETVPSAGSFAIVQGKAAATLCVDSGDWAGVVRAVGDLQADVERVTGDKPAICADAAALKGNAIIVGTVGKSALIDRLIQARKIDVTGIKGKWESFFLQVVQQPMPGVASALVIAGSDKRGTTYGVYDLSEQIGVSPWYWWADVTPEHKDALFVKAGKFAQGEPSVKYRGIFFNDEKPDLDYWVRAKFGERTVPGGTSANFNSAFYSKVFEVILRMKGNYLWPAMWNNAFAEDDPANPRLADEYGIVMGTSHQEPMLRAQKEWDWHLRAANGNWNYATQANILDDFWRQGNRQRKDFESIYPRGLRGENDSAMVRTAEEGVALTEKIVAAQRKLLAEEVNPDVTKVPQLWALYKEVQQYYEGGLRVPGDITLLWAEDNWGNLRRLPTPEERKRSGGAGIYYHFDYHGGPRSYQWVNTSPVNKIWEQMSLAKQYGADRIWIVNVGHFKGYELPTEFFLSLGWNADRWHGDTVNDFTRQWAEREFGAAYASEAAAIMDAYTDYNARRKPELVEPGTYSLVNYREAERVEEDYNALAARAEALYAKIPAAKRDAFFQLVLFPTKACANLNAMYVAAGKNALYASQGRAGANSWAGKVKTLFDADAALTKQWDELNGGKWLHFMDQPHIGYRSWADPPANTLAAIKLANVEAPAEASLGVATDGGSPTLPAFDSLNQQRSYVDVFNKGRAPFDFTATASAPWIALSQSKGRVEDETRVWVTIDWAKAPAGVNPGSIKITGAGHDETIQLTARKPSGLTRATLAGFAEGAGYVAIDAGHFSAKVDAGQAAFVPVEQYGMMTHAPVDVQGLSGGPHLDYRIYLFTPGEVTASLKLGPALNFAPDRAVRIAVSMDSDAPQVLTIVPQGYNAANGVRDWEQSVRDNARYVTSKHPIAAAGYHTFKVWMVDPGVVVERILIDTPASAKAVSYLGPPESYRGIAARPVTAAAKKGL